MKSKIGRGWASFGMALCLLGLGMLSAHAATVQVASDPRVVWGVGQVQAALDAVGQGAASGTPATIDVLVSTTGDDLGGTGRKPECYRLRATGDRVQVIGFDAAGALYGCLDLARRIREMGRVPDALDVNEGPALGLRAVSVFLKKQGTSDHAITPQTFPFFYDRDGWTRYLDFMAHNGLNGVVLWNGHPFDYFVKLDATPEAQSSLDPAILQQNHDQLLWLCAEAEKRNIVLMFQFDNIHTSADFAKAHSLPEQGVNAPSDLLAAYTGQGVERFLATFPGVGLWINPGGALEAKYAADWIEGVVFAAVARSGRTPAITVQSAAIDLDTARRLAGKYPRLRFERGFNADMVAGTDVDPATREWATVSGKMISRVNSANLEPFRWTPPSYIQRAVQSMAASGATGLHLFPRKPWRWPVGCDKADAPEPQLQRDQFWFEMWARYAWNPNLDPATERSYWIYRFTQRYGVSAAAENLLNSYEFGADVLPCIQRLLWTGADGHSVLSAGALLPQIEAAPGAPFLPMDGQARIPALIAALKAGQPSPGTNPLDVLSAKVAEAEKALEAARAGAPAATLNQADAQRLTTDAEAVVYLARFYRHKASAAVAKALFEANVEPAKNAQVCLENLRASVEDFRALTALTEQTYESLSDVPAVVPATTLPTPYHWRDALPLYQQELAAIEADFAVRAPDPASANVQTTVKGWDANSPLAKQEQDRLAALLQQAQAALAPAAAPDAWTARRADLRAKLQSALGLDPLPERTPHNAKSLGVLDYPECTLEKIELEGFAGMPMAAHFYLPKNVAPPLPVVLHIPGAAETGKLSDAARTLNFDLVRQGIAVLCIDTLGQGERFSAAEDTRGFPLLAGATQQGLRVWEAVRAVDYLHERADIDKARVALTGDGAGGLTAVFAAALDDRIAATAPVNCATTFATLGGQDTPLRPLVPGLMSVGTMAEVMGMVAPKPLRQISAVEDPDFAIAGARENAQALQALYTLLGAPQNTTFVETPGPAGLTQPQREAVTGFFAQTLLAKGDGAAIAEAPVALEPAADPKFRCFPEGNRPAGPQVVALVNARIAAAQPLNAAAPGEDVPGWQKQVGDALRAAATVHGEYAVTGADVQAADVDGVHLRKVLLTPEPGASVPMVLMQTTGTTPTSAVVLMGPRPKADTLASPLARRLLEKGALVGVLDLRGLGEAEAGLAKAERLCLLGRTAMGEWSADLQQAARYLKTQGIARVCVVGQKGFGDIALFAATCAPEIDAVVAEGALASYRDLLDPALKPAGSAYVPNLLRRADVPELLGAIAPRKVVLLGTVNAAGQPIAADRIAALAGNGVYAKANAAAALAVSPPAPLTADVIAAALQP